MNTGIKYDAHLPREKQSPKRQGWFLDSVYNEEPLRSELFSADQMAQHGKVLAGLHQLTDKHAPDQLLSRLADNETILIGVCTLLKDAIGDGCRITPAGEWLLDNFYLIEEQISTTKRHLPKGYSRELPRLEENASVVQAGIPRVYDIALEIISHGDGRMDIEVLGRFIEAYQRVSPLKLGELWATPIMLRLAVIENLRRVGVRVAAGCVERNQAGVWADLMTETAEQDPKNLIVVVADMARSNPPMVGAFVAELARRLQGRGPALALPLTWIEQRLSEVGMTTEQMIQIENQQQAAAQVSISNSIGSLRVLGASNWRDFVESMSLVERTLREDPKGIYARMDFATRDHYRHVTEALAKKSDFSEIDVARKTVELAMQGEDERTSHVGYYLVDKGLPVLEEKIGERPSLMAVLLKTARRYPLFLYLGSILLVTLLISSLWMTQATPGWSSDLKSSGSGNAWGTAGYYLRILLISAFSLLAASQLGVALVNWLSTLVVKPSVLPRMDYSEGIPEALRTLVVVPTMISSASGLEDLTEALEVRFLANRDEYMHFGLLTDFGDAAEQTLPGDEALLQLARTRINELNAKYTEGKDRTLDNRFFLFHRARQWNAKEKIWMGYERKRGKLAELNALLRSDRPVVDSSFDFPSVHEGFALIVGNTTVLPQVKYVITLDTDTQLPRDAARQFVGAMAHPLNHPRYDEVKERVVEGYGILQPRVAISLPGTNRSRYARLYGGEPGIDPYTRAVSDVYQDIFGEGSFIGKGIYDVDAFEHALAGRFPENQILSHDLLEGCYARAGLLSDVNLYEEYPTRYSADVSRRYRWIRGDWQLACWLLRRVPHIRSAGKDNAKSTQEQRMQKNPLSLLSQWKLFDNLRRSVVPIALTLLLVLGWFFLDSALFWTLAVISVLLIPSLCSLFVDALRKPAELALRQHLYVIYGQASLRVVQTVFELGCLPYEAFFSLEAILRTAWRMKVSRRRMLEWNPSGEVDRTTKWKQNVFLSSLRTMWISPLMAGAITSLLVLYHPLVLFVAGPILLLWFFSPITVWWFSRTLVPKKINLSKKQHIFLGALTRRTWAFFDNFVTAEDNWLPPDNYQEYRIATVAHRTSPTNIGLALLANLTAHDFAYIPTGILLERTSNTLATMDKLERYRGHFYNWYDTESLQILMPQYISTVDSGNLAAHLLILRAGLLALVDEKIISTRLFTGLRDTLVVLEEAIGKTVFDAVAEFRNTLEKVSVLSSAPVSNDKTDVLSSLYLSLKQLTEAANKLLVEINENADTSNTQNIDNDDANGEKKKTSVTEWALALTRQCHAALDELNFLVPWLGSPILYERANAADMFVGGIERNRIPTLRDLAKAGSLHAQDRIATIESLAEQAGEYANMDYTFLFDKTRHLLAIGYNVGEHRMDAGYYDLLASEARLGSFVAIAQGQLSQENWFALGRLLTGTGGEPTLLSWSGSMFEYLMPLLVMPTYENTLLDQTCKSAVAWQIEYGKQRGVPWGVSESGYNSVDLHLNYQYRAFGVPGLGLKRGLEEDLVIAPYASVMALMVAPEAACQNLQRLEDEGFLGRFGFFEAIDYTPARQRRKEKKAVVRSFMAHHQGMSLLALAYLLLDRPMQRRFESEPLFQAVMPLLHERIPKTSTLFTHTTALSLSLLPSAVAEAPIRVFTKPNTPTPEVQLLSNGRYHVMVTNAGGGYSRWKDLAVTRWYEDATCDNWGSFCYIREVNKEFGKKEALGEFWSSAYQPTLKTPAHYEAIFSEGRAEFRRRDAVGAGFGGEGFFETHTEIVVSPEDDIELRRVRITNRSKQRREIEVTSYAEVVIAPAAADAMHPAFSNLFVQTEILPERHAVLSTRRPRSSNEEVPWMLQLMAVHDVITGEVSYETDRSRFIGRGRTTAAPLALIDAGPLSGTQGSVLDPIVAIRYSFSLGPEQTVTIDMVSGMAETRDTALYLIDKYQDRHLSDRVLDLAWTHSQVVLRQLNTNEADAQFHARLASLIIYANTDSRAEASILMKNCRGQSGLWGYAISGDLPIVLLQISNVDNIGLVHQLVQAHAYWRQKGLAVDLVIWNEDHAGYRQQLQDQIMGLITSGIEASVIDRPGGIFVRLAEQISNEDRILFQSVARAVISDSNGTLEEQIENRRLAEPRPPRLIPSRAVRPERTNDVAKPDNNLILSNGCGAFTADGREYIIHLPPEMVTPAPWSNVLANPHFGTVVSESGMGYTWSENAHEFRLSSWHNDPVSDKTAEAIYLRDEESGYFWSPTPLPVRAATTYTVRHGFGYSVFETHSGGIHSELWVYVALDAAVKFSVLKIRNDSGRARKLSATAYIEWVLGDSRAKSAMHIQTEIDPKTGTLYAKNAYNTEFPDRQAFLDVDDATRTLTGDRREFIGRNGTLGSPAAMRRVRLSGKVGAGLDPCAAIQVRVDLANGQEREIIFRLGMGRNAEEAGKLVSRFRGAVAARGALDAVWQYWRETLNAVQVETPDPALNVMANGWLVYQTLACRIWARSGYYQSGGAFGFRDQLQDVMSLIHTKPALVREHLVLYASRQFVEGDVQHWWHPPVGRGVRTHCSDDYLWLPLAVSRYVVSSGDTGVLDESVSFLEGRAVNPDEDSYYDMPNQSAEVASLYQHCVRAISHGLRFGERGLPLMGSGDWNDGMNLVGMGGKGESVWLGFFLCDVLQKFAPVAAAYGDQAFADLCLNERDQLSQNIEAYGWDGQWYRRAYFDDGTPLGSESNVECRIDSVSQSWSVLSGVGSEARTNQAMRSLNEHLVRRDAGLIQLLDPPFDSSDMDPGYIRGYVPGVRENGGQYTHAAVWATMAFAALGDRKNAWELLRLINPVNHGLTPEAIAIYKVEPYVVSADVYAVSPHIGRGGWSWYTGSAGWMYRLILESLLGIHLEGDHLSLSPCLPEDWPEIKIHYRYRETMYHLVIRQVSAMDEANGDHGATRVSLDGEILSSTDIPLVDDRGEHWVELVMTIE